MCPLNCRESFQYFERLPIFSVCRFGFVDCFIDATLALNFLDTHLPFTKGISEFLQVLNCIIRSHIAISSHCEVYLLFWLLPPTQVRLSNYQYSYDCIISADNNSRVCGRQEVLLLLWRMTECCVSCIWVCLAFFFRCNAPVIFSLAMVLKWMVSGHTGVP